MKTRAVKTRGTTAEKDIGGGSRYMVEYKYTEPMCGKRYMYWEALH